LERLRGRDLAAELPRRPGEKQTRWRQLVGADGAPGDTGEVEPDWTSERLDRLEAEVAAIRSELARLRGELGS
ncbi:MAG TPA: hypothetical protein VHF58_07695, partial [Solirubrobacterales bacterium]|nr:hypothetical protein [Solirubrobacterales bacterium]